MSKYTGYKYSKAQQDWKRDNTKPFYFRFNIRTDADIIAHLDAQPNKLGYIKALIRADIDKFPTSTD